MATVTGQTAQASTDEGQILDDLERYRVRVLELGATDAKAIRAEDVIVDERVRAKCRYPLCSNYNTNMNCPPHGMRVDGFRTLLGRYRFAILFKIDVTSGRIEDFKIANRRVSTDIVWKLESEAFYEGYWFAVGFGGGSCKDMLCPKLECAALAGKGCRHEYRARPGMHTVGIDVFATAARVGWELYPAGSSCDISSLPHLSTIGLVLVD